MDNTYWTRYHVTKSVTRPPSYLSWHDSSLAIHFVWKDWYFAKKNCSIVHSKYSRSFALEGKNKKRVTLVWISKLAFLNHYFALCEITFIAKVKLSKSALRQLGEMCENIQIPDLDSSKRSYVELNYAQWCTSSR